MDKITRMLLLYSKLMKGETVNKARYCVENECSPRSFDRDIEDIRIYLSESFSATELIYDRSENTYHITGAQTLELEPMEYLFIQQLLKDTAILRNDEFQILLSHLLSKTAGAKELLEYQKDVCCDYQTPLHNKALLKMHSDLLSVIRKNKKIQIKYLEKCGEEVSHNIIPCTVKIDFANMYLVGYRADSKNLQLACYRIDKIHSFEIINDQTYMERQKVKICLSSGENEIKKALSKVEEREKKNLSD